MTAKAFAFAPRTSLGVNIITRDFTTILPTRQNISSVVSLLWIKRLEIQLKRPTKLFYSKKTGKIRQN
jgi:hypothetical protein